jgi:opacity protein-like surface antigen
MSMVASWWKRPRALAVVSSVLAICFGLMSESSAHAQALPVLTGPGTYVGAGAGVTAFQADYGQRVLGGGVVWADVNFTWQLGAEGEARYLRLHTDEDVTEKMYLGGVRYTFRPQRLRPYAKFLIGAGEISLPFHYAQGTFLAYAPGAGVDFHVNDHLIWRVVDFEYQTWPDFTYGNLKPYGVSMGLIYRQSLVSRVARFPKK